MGSRYMVSGRSAATAATADNVGATLWNPHASKPIFVFEAWWFKVTGTVDNLGLVRTSTRGTQTASQTPDADNDFARAVAPISTAVLDLTYSAQPTLAKPYLASMPLAAAVGVGCFIAFGEGGLVVPAGTGLAWATPQTVILQAADATFVWGE